MTTSPTIAMRWWNPIRPPSNSRKDPAQAAAADRVSGAFRGKSLHAIVRIEAGSYDEYRRRVDRLYEICRKNGLEVDSQNRNPSRLSRMPGVMRAGKKQYLLDTNIGKPTLPSGWNG